MELVFLIAAVGFVLIGGGSLELGTTEAKVGPLGARADRAVRPVARRLGAGGLGRVGPAEPALVGRRRGSGDGIVRWPSAIAGVVVGLLLCRAMKRAIGARAAGLLALAWFGQLALIDRSADAGVDLIAGLGTILALNRMLTQGLGLGRGPVCVVGVPRRGLAAAGDDRAGDDRPRPPRGDVLDQDRDPRPRDGRRLVGLGPDDDEGAGLGRRAEPAADAGVGVDDGPGRDRAGPAVVADRGARIVEAGPRRVDSAGQALRDRLGPGRAGEPGGRDGHPGTGSGGPDDGPGGHRRRRGGVLGRGPRGSARDRGAAMVPCLEPDRDARLVGGPVDLGGLSLGGRRLLPGDGDRAHRPGDRDDHRGRVGVAPGRPPGLTRGARAGGDLAQAGPLGASRARVELSPRPGPLGPRDRPVGPAADEPVRPRRLAVRPRLRDRQARAAGPQPDPPARPARGRARSSSC